MKYIVCQYGGFHGANGAKAAYEYTSGNSIYICNHFYDRHLFIQNKIDLSLFCYYPLIFARLLRLSRLYPRLLQFLDSIQRYIFLATLVIKTNKSTKLMHFYSSNNKFLYSLNRKKRIINVLDWGIAHPTYLQNVLDNERSARGLHMKTISHESADLYDIQMADQILVPSEFVANTFYSNGVCKSRIKIIPYGVDVDAFKFSPSQYGRNSDTLKIAFSGALSIRKGIFYLLDAVSHLRKAGYKIELYLFGEVDSEIESIVHFDYDFIRHKGGIRRDLLSSSYENIDLFVLPTFAEGMARAVLEALACGLPCITTTSSGYAGVIDESCGAIIEPGSTQQLVDAIKRYCNDPDFLSISSEFARLKALDYTWDRYKESLIKFYDSFD